jgi:hypothetical protein
MSITTLSKLPPKTQRTLLLQDIPHRICASLTWLKTMDGDWAMPPDPEWKNKDKDKFHIYCVGRSVDEGRKAAMRWLIEFVGIAKDNKTKRPKKPAPLRGHEDEQVLIERLDHGKLFDIHCGDAIILAEVWKGCTQASMHATTNTGHPLVEPKNLAEALKIIIAYLENNLYTPNGFTLWDVIQDQEDRKRFKL